MVSFGEYDSIVTILDRYSSVLHLIEIVIIEDAHS